MLSEYRSTIPCTGARRLGLKTFRRSAPTRDKKFVLSWSGLNFWSLLDAVTPPPPRDQEGHKKEEFFQWHGWSRIRDFLGGFHDIYRGYRLLSIWTMFSRHTVDWVTGRLYALGRAPATRARRTPGMEQNFGISNGNRTNTNHRNSECPNICSSWYWWILLEVQKKWIFKRIFGGK